MKKIFLLPVLALSLLFGAGLTKDVKMAQAEEIISVEETISSEEEVVFEEKVFTFEDIDATYKVTLTSEDTYTLEATNKETGTVITITDKYILVGSTLILYGQEEVMWKFEILADGTLQEVYVENEEPSVEYPCTVVINDYQFGEVIVDLEYGNVGDIVTIWAKPYSLCKLSSITVNGVNLTANEDGNYKFSLIEGENVISVSFVIDNESIEFIAGIITDVQEGGFEELFTIKNLFSLISLVLNAFLGIGFVISTIKTKKVKSKTSKEIAKDVEMAVETKTANAINSFLNETFAPVFDKINLKMTEVDDVCKTLARCFILSQENTPEARLAIIDELTKLEKSGKELSEQVRAIINLEISKNEEIRNQKKQAIEELKKQNETLTKKDNSTVEDIEGRY